MLAYAMPDVGTYSGFAGQEGSLKKSHVISTWICDNMPTVLSRFVGSH